MWFLWLVLGLIAALGLNQVVRVVRRTPAKSFANQVVLITGGSKGYGQSLGQVFLECGARVCLVARGLPALRQAQDEIVAALGEDVRSRVFLASADVTDAGALAQAVRECETHFGAPVDVLVACAGSAMLGYAKELGLEVYRRSMELNFFGVLNAVRAVLPGMVKRAEMDPAGAKAGPARRLILVSSGMSLTGYIGYTAYAPSKWAVRGLAESLRNELLPYGIRVHHVMPPNMDTPGFAEEERCKPVETRRLEGASVGLQTPDESARNTLRALREEHFNIVCADTGLQLLLKGSAGMAPRQNPLLDSLAGLIIPLVGWIVRSDWDKIVCEGPEKAQKWLQEQADKKEKKEKQSKAKDERKQD